MSEVEITEGTNAVEAKLAEAGVDAPRRYSFSESPEAAPEQGTPAEEEVQAEAGQLRNELGQFASEQPEVPEVPEEEQQAEGKDPAVSAFLQKYGGDVEKALAGAVHLQRKAGEQSNELGDLRRMVDELQSLRETVQADYQQRQQNVPLDQATVDWFDQEAYNNPHGAAEYARQQNNPMLHQRAMAIWKEQDPYSAAVYTTRLENAQLQQQLEQKVNAASQLPADANLHMALSNVRAKHPEYVNYDEAIGATMEKYPYMRDAVEAAYSSGDRTKLEGALETLYGLAVGDTLANLALTGETPETATTSAEVVAPTTSETREPAPEPTPLDLFRESFKQEADTQRRGVWVAD